MKKTFTHFKLAILGFLLIALFCNQNLQAQVCTGSPIPGNTLATTLTPCPGVGDNLYIQNFSSLGSGVVFQWYNSSGPISGATNAFYTAVLFSGSETYWCDVVCTTSGLSASTTPVTLTVSNFLYCYCTSNATAIQDEEIYNVTLNGSSTNPLYSMSNGCTNVAPGPGSILKKYSSFMTLPSLTTLFQGMAYTFSILQDDCDGPVYFANKIGIWIDYNHNGSFSDPGELVYMEPALLIGPKTVSGTFVVPISALTGNTVMRIVCAEGMTPSPCGTYSYGETEDYLIDIQSSTPCTGAPNPGNTMASSTIICSGAVCNLSLQFPITPSVGITYQWYNSAGSISGAVNSTYAPVLIATETFYCIVTCVSSGMSATSTPITVNVTPPVTASSSVTACDSYFWNANTYTLSGNYMATFSSATGCDSIHGLNLTINQSSAATMTLSGCDSVQFGGNTYTMSGVYTQTYTNASGCDSVEYMSVNIQQSYDTTIVHSDCDFYTFNSVLYTSSGIYTHTFTNGAGCDSIIHLDLTIHLSTDSSISSMACNLFTLNGITYTNTGTFTQTLSNAYGCDSIIMLQVTIDTLTALITTSGTGISTPSIGSYQWLDCNTNMIIPGATNLNYIPALGGSYAVIVTTATCVDTSICLTVWATNTNNITNAENSCLYPNPHHGVFELSLADDAEVMMTNALGEVILQTNLSKGKHKIDISNYAQGVYFLKLNTDGKIHTQKMLKE